MEVGRLKWLNFNGRNQWDKGNWYALKYWKSPGTVFLRNWNFLKDSLIHFYMQHPTLASRFVRLEEREMLSLGIQRILPTFSPLAPRTPSVLFLFHPISLQLEALFFCRTVNHTFNPRSKMYSISFLPQTRKLASSSQKQKVDFPIWFF